MSILRFFAGALGALTLLVLAPLTLMWGNIVNSSEIADSFWLDNLRVLLIFIVFSAGYFLVAIYGQRIIHSVKLRVTTAVLLAIQISITAIPLVHFNHPETWPFVLPILVFSTLLFFAFVWPAWFQQA